MKPLDFIKGNPYIAAMTFLLLVAVSIFGATRYPEAFNNILFFFFVFLPPGLVFATAFVQMASVQSQKKILTAAVKKGNPISNSSSFKVAPDYYESIPVEKFVLFSEGYKIPIGVLSLIILTFSIVMFYGNHLSPYHGIYYILAGMSKVNMCVKEIELYQTGTIITMIMAFVGAYIVILIRLFRRINNYDINPMSYYFFSLHILQAVLVAIVIRHAIYALIPLDPGVLWLSTIGFGVGLKPDLFMQFIAEKAMEKIGKKSPKDVVSANIPSTFPLSMVEGLTEEKQYRLEELDIDNCHQLAEQNPFILWVRTSYQLMHIIDWIAQAQLYLLVKEDGIHKLRQYAIRDIFSFISAVDTDTGSKLPIANLLNIDEKLLDSIVSSVKKEPKFTRLKEVRKCLCPSEEEQTTTNKTEP